MIHVDRTIFFPYSLYIMLTLSRHRHRWCGSGMLIAPILAAVLPFCLVAGTMASQDSCQDLGSPPGLCSKAASHADHLLGVPAPLINALPYSGTSEILFQYVVATFPSFGFLSTPDGRAPPLA